MPDFNVTMDDRLLRLLSRYQKDLPEVLESGVLEAAQHAEGEIKRVLFSMGKGGGRFYREIANSFKSQFVADSKGKIYAAEAFSKHVAAKIQNEGGIIHPTQKRNLAIPISDKAKKTVGFWPRHWAPGKLKFIINRKTGKKLLVELKGSYPNQTFDVHYVLKKSVKIRRKRYLEQARKRALPGIYKILEESMKELTNGK